MTRKVVTVSVDSTMTEVAKIMREKNVGAVVVCKGKKPVGIITEWDIMKKVVEQDKKPSEILARQIMSSPLITVTRKTEAIEALRIMRKRGIRRLPVVEKGKLLGLVTTIDLLPLISQEEIMEKVEEIVGEK